MGRLGLGKLIPKPRGSEPPQHGCLVGQETLWHGLLSVAADGSPRARQRHLRLTVWWFAFARQWCKRCHLKQQAGR